MLNFLHHTWCTKTYFHDNCDAKQPFYVLAKVMHGSLKHGKLASLLGFDTGSCGYVFYRLNHSYFQKVDAFFFCKIKRCVWSSLDFQFRVGLDGWIGNELVVFFSCGRQEHPEPNWILTRIFFFLTFFHPGLSDVWCNNLGKPAYLNLIHSDQFKPLRTYCGMRTPPFLFHHSCTSNLQLQSISQISSIIMNLIYQRLFFYKINILKFTK